MGWSRKEISVVLAFLLFPLKSSYWVSNLIIMDMTVFRFSGGSDGKASVYNAGDLGSSPGLGRSLAIHSNTIAWRIPWTEEPGRLQSMGSQRVGHD